MPLNTFLRNLRMGLSSLDNTSLFGLFISCEENKVLWIYPVVYFFLIAIRHFDVYQPVAAPTFRNRVENLERNLIFFS
jgi:hypothetical protein